MVHSLRFSFSRSRRVIFTLIGALGLILAEPCMVAAQRPAGSVRMFGIDYVEVRAFAQSFGLSATWSVPQKGLRLKSPNTEIELTVHSVETTLNGVRLFLSEPVVLRDGQLYVSRGDVDQLFAPILAPVASNVPGLKTIAIDAGHGGNDPGNQNRHLKLDEKVLTLDVARRLQRLLLAKGYRVVMTRSSDRFVDLDRRTEIANRAGADLFISIHFNAFSDPAIAGAETFVMTPHRLRSSPQAERDDRMPQTRYAGNAHDRWNALLGFRLHRSLSQSLRTPDRGLKRFRFSVLRTIECPALLIEAAFLSNPAEARKVMTAAYRQQIADAIATGVVQYGAGLEALRRRRPRSG